MFSFRLLSGEDSCKSEGERLLWQYYKIQDLSAASLIILHLSDIRHFREAPDFAWQCVSCVCHFTVVWWLIRKATLAVTLSVVDIELHLSNRPTGFTLIKPAFKIRFFMLVFLKVWSEPTSFYFSKLPDLCSSLFCRDRLLFVIVCPKPLTEWWPF